ncbi:hypothetical protein GCM10010435_12980 [Winogradskya consettensis]|uniref:Uncharacterized protein n=1 Tax=Winogradskya consettensis TaxID=113560 RepID=A0A919SAM5_9ACTN|nr:hypothetical protein [Actinoplanes consettensis]GIM68781.1 hypothetical protein Aco04nite_12250 [Actinoplanes consettensis]
MRRSILIVLAAGLAGLAAGLIAPGNGLSGGGQLALPQRISTPYPWTPGLDQAPLRSASVLVDTGDIDNAGNAGNSGNAGNTVGVVGDSYRRLSFAGPPGEGALLSPDGTRIAYRVLGALVIRAIDGTSTRVFPDGSGGGGPRGWSADGTLLAVDRGTQLGLLEPGSGQVRAVGTVPAEWDGPVAFTRAGDRLAYQVGQRMVIAGTDGAQESEFAVPAGMVLSGKGAWTPDGASLLVGGLAGDGWQFRTLRASDGSVDPAPALGVLRHAVAGRALGWRPDGTLVAVAYEPAAAFPGAGPLVSGSGSVSSGTVAGVRVVGLVRGDAAERLLMEVPEGVSGVDVAGQAVVRSGPAVGVAVWPVARWWLAGVVFVVLAVAGLWRLHGRGLPERLRRALGTRAARRAGKKRGPGDGGEVRVSGGENPADARPAGPRTEIRE